MPPPRSGWSALTSWPSAASCCCADLFGQRRVLIAAMSVFVFSLLGACADDALLLIVSRFIKGMTAAFTAPAATSLMAGRSPKARTARSRLA
ncbi:MFS transporter [Streptomyces decoyicus]|uniref:MFS transporter n=1 Tax=Streptomyces decoyicus TaxID=249567 RepID=UPI003869CD49